MVSGSLRRIPRPVALQYRLRERVLGPGGRTPRQATDAIRRLAVDDVTRFSMSHQLGFEDTLLRLIDGTTSLARFGDGELLSMLRPGYDLYFQRTTPELSAELRSIWTMQNLDADSLLLGFPDLSKGPYWSDVWTNAWPDLRLISRTDITYGNIARRPAALLQSARAARSRSLATGLGRQVRLFRHRHGLTLRAHCRAVRQRGHRLAGGRAIDRRLRSRRCPRAAAPRSSGRHPPAVTGADGHRSRGSARAARPKSHRHRAHHQQLPNRLPR